MKKIRLYLILFGTILLVPSCVDPLNPGTIPVDIEGEYGIDLSVFCTAPGTKSTPKPGVDDYNENLLSTVDWFVFESEADGSVLFDHGQVISPDQTVENSTALKTDDIKIKQLLSMDRYVTEKGKTGYVYVIANLPDNSATITDGTTTLADLRSIALTADFGKLTNKKFTKQDNFVMSGGVAFDFNDGKHLTKKAELSRVAAKITLKLNIAPAIDEEKQLASGEMKYQQTWYPVLAPTTVIGDNNVEKTFNGVQVYLSFANNKSDMKGTPSDYNQDDFFTYNRYAFIPTYNYVVITPGEDDTETYQYGANPSTTFPTTPTSMLPNGWEDNSKVHWGLTGSPFYTYPMTWETDSPQAPFIKIIVEWTPYQETSFVRDPETNKLIRASRNYVNSGPNGNTKEFFYKIPMPDAANCKLLPNDWYELTFNVSILGSTSEELPLELSGQYCVVDWSDPHISAGGNLIEGSYLSTESDTYYIYGGNSIIIPVRSSHNISTQVLGVAFTDYSNMDPTNYTYPVTGNQVGLSAKPFTITTPLDRRAYADDGSGQQNTKRDEFTFTHNLVSDINASTTTVDNPPDVSEYTFHVKITNEAGNEKTIKVIQQPPLMIKNDLNSGSNNKGYVYVNGSNNSDAQWGGVNGVQTTGNNSNKNMYVITASVAPSSSIIADPRSQTIDYLGYTNYNWTTAYGYTMGGGNTRRRLQNYYPSETSEVGKNKIAPKFRIASSYGRIVSTSSWGPSVFLTYQEAQRRCATYQEDGFPAGRWRIPTYAEIIYMITLANLNLIPPLFNPEQPTSGNRPNYAAGGYWSADKGVVYPFTDNTIGYLSDTEFNSTTYSYAKRTNGVRCVYDEWYWGTDDRLPQNQRNRFTWGDRAL